MKLRTAIKVLRVINWWPKGSRRRWWQPFPEPPTPVELAIAERDHLRTVLQEICSELYGRGFEVSGWHLNGALEPLDTWFDDNGWCEAAEANELRNEPSKGEDHETDDQT